MKIASLIYDGEGLEFAIGGEGLGILGDELAHLIDQYVDEINGGDYSHLADLADAVIAHHDILMAYLAD